MEELAAQLRTPSGGVGVEVSDRMHDSKLRMTLEVLDALELNAGDHVLEIGQGNGKHIPDLTYMGLELSKLMQSQARSHNTRTVLLGQTQFLHYDGTALPFEPDTFDKILSVNTIYFWHEPTAMMGGIVDVLKPGGSLVLAYAAPDFMSDLPFVKHGFKTYSDAAVIGLLDSALARMKLVKHCCDATISKH